MKKLIFFLMFLMFLGLGIGEVNAQKFLAKFIDTDGSGNVEFIITGSNWTTQDFYVGVDNGTFNTNILSIPASSGGLPTYNGNNYSLSPGIYDIYLTDKTNYYYTSQGYANGTINYGFLNSLVIDWNNVPVGVTFKTLDKIEIVPVPLPSNLWFLAGGLLLLGAFGIVRKRFSLN